MIAAATIYGFGAFCVAVLLAYLAWALLFAEDL